MRTKDAFSLKKFAPVHHKQLGDCIVLGMAPNMGRIILPITAEGLAGLTAASGMPPGTPFLASDYKQMLKPYVETPEAEE
jgi:hypothetical protein